MCESSQEHNVASLRNNIRCGCKGKHWQMASLTAQVTSDSSQRLTANVRCKMLYKQTYTEFYLNI
jgi:hypothetical protein